MIPFNKPPYTGNEDKYVLQAMKSNKISGDGEFGKRCQKWFESKLNCKKALLTPSCTAALEMAAILRWYLIYLAPLQVKFVLPLLSHL